MKTYEVSEEFIKEAFEVACETWKGKIKKEFPELFEVKLELGRWYYVKVDGDEFMFQRTQGSRDLVFGFNRGEWREPNVDYWSWRDGDERLRLATKEEIETMLWKEAEKRGFKEGVRYIAVTGNVFTAKGRIEYGWNGGDNLHFNQSEGLIYDCGKWATPLNEKKEIQDKIDSLQKQLDELKLKVK